MNKKERILELLKSKPKVFCWELINKGLYHHASQRIGELNREGYKIQFHRATSWEACYYELKGTGSILENAITPLVLQSEVREGEKKSGSIPEPCKDLDGERPNILNKPQVPQVSPSLAFDKSGQKGFIFDEEVFN